MGKIRTTYQWCSGCERRIALQLFKADRCPGCHDDAKRKLQRKEVPFTEEEYEAMGEVTHVAEDYE